MSDLAAEDSPGPDDQAESSMRWDSKRRWIAMNPDKVRAHREKYRAAHMDEIREASRLYGARVRKAQQMAKRRRAKARERYWADPDAHRDYQRERRAAQRAADPIGYREAKRMRSKRWRDSHRDELNARRRAKYLDNLEVKREAAARYYAAHREEVRARRRAYYWANRERQLATQAEWRKREARRKSVGLPPRRVRGVSAVARAANRTDADAFFARERTTTERVALEQELATPETELARFERQSARARMAAILAADPETLDRNSFNERRRLERAAAEAKDAAAARERQELEDARMDAIARAINDRLRINPRPQRRNHAPAPAPQLEQGGISL